MSRGGGAICDRGGCGAGGRVGDDEPLGYVEDAEAVEGDGEGVDPEGEVADDYEVWLE